MKRLSKEQILMLHSQLIEQTGGTVGVRDFNLLESAIETPFQVLLIIIFLMPVFNLGKVEHR